MTTIEKRILKQARKALPELIEAYPAIWTNESLETLVVLLRSRFYDGRPFGASRLFGYNYEF